MDRLHNGCWCTMRTKHCLLRFMPCTMLEQMTLEYHHYDWIFMMMTTMMMMNGTREWLAAFSVCWTEHAFVGIRNVINPQQRRAISKKTLSYDAALSGIEIERGRFSIQINLSYLLLYYWYVLCTLNAVWMLWRLTHRFISASSNNYATCIVYTWLSTRYLEILTI